MAARRQAACLVAVLALAGTLAPAAAGAQQPASDRARAEDLFQEGRRLMEEGRLATACARFAASHGLEPAGGTLLNLAVCHELEGKLPLAWSEFEEALGYARRDGQPDRESLARQHLLGLQPRLAFLVVTLAPGADAAGLAVSLDGAPLRRALLGRPLPRLPGPAHLAARAPGAAAWTSAVTMVAGQRLALTVPRLDAAPPPAPPPGAAPAPRPTPASTTTWPPRRVGALVSSGVAVVALTVGAVYGVRAMSRASAANALCPDSGPCGDPTALRLNHDARTAAVVADVTLALGLVSAGVATWLWLTSRERPARAQAVARRPLAVAPVVTAGGGGFALGGAW